MKKRLLALGLTAGAGAAYYGLTTPRVLADPHPSRPAKTYDEALAQLAALQAVDAARVNPVCRTRLLTHGRRVQHAMVMLHGFTNCPHQFDQFAQAVHGQGVNVLVPRMPGHGLERMADDLGALRAADLMRAAGRALDLAHGLGQAVTVFGFSMGGVLAAWCAQNRPDADRVVLVSPGLGMAAVPPALMTVYANALGWLPNAFHWWDPERKDKRIGPGHAYPRFATRGIAAILRLSVSVQQQARRRRPAVEEILVVTNPCDDVVRNSTVDDLVFHWRLHGVDVATHALPAAWRLIHDIIDPQQVDQQTARVYPVLLDLLG